MTERPILRTLALRTKTMSCLSVLKTIVNFGLALFLFTRGLSLPADSPEPWELAAALYYGSWGWLQAWAGWWSALP